MTTATTHMALDRCWPEAGVSRVPFWAYTDLQVYEQEMRLFSAEKHSVFDSLLVPNSLIYPL